MRGKCAQKKLRTCDLGCEIKDVSAVDHESTMLFTLNSPVVFADCCKVILACFRLNFWRRLKSRDFWVTTLFLKALLLCRVSRLHQLLFDKFSWLKLPEKVSYQAIRSQNSNWVVMKIEASSVLSAASFVPFYEVYWGCVYPVKCWF